MRPGVYRHFKGGIYFVLGTVLHSESQVEMVVYVNLATRARYVRPTTMFEEIVDRDGYKGPRFARITDWEAAIQQLVQVSRTTDEYQQFLEGLMHLSTVFNDGDNN